MSFPFRICMCSFLPRITFFGFSQLCVFTEPNNPPADISSSLWGGEYYWLLISALFGFEWGRPWWTKIASLKHSEHWRKFISRFWFCKKSRFEILQTLLIERHGQHLCRRSLIKRSISLVVFASIDIEKLTVLVYDQDLRILDLPCRHNALLLLHYTFK